MLTTGSSANILATSVARYSAYGLITSVNGEPAGGSWSARIVAVEARPPAGVYLLTWTFDITEADGTPAGVVTASGIIDGPGVPVQRNLPIVGSTNAYYGVHGTIGRDAVSGGSTNSEVQKLEDGSGEFTFVATLRPLCRSAVAMRDGLPAIAHGKDFTMVTSNAPAEPGEILSLVATDLLPELKETTPPAEPEALPNAPVTIRVGGLTTKILYIGKYPGAKSAYQINFRVPPDVQAGIVDVQISTGFIGGPVASISVR